VADRGEHLDEAGTLIKKAVELDPDNGAYLDSLGWFYFNTATAKRRSRNCSAPRKISSAKRSTTTCGARPHRRRLLETRQIPEALTYWQKALALEQDDKDLTTRISEKVEARNRRSPPALQCRTHPSRSRPQPASLYGHRPRVGHVLVAAAGVGPHQVEHAVLIHIAVHLIAASARTCFGGVFISSTVGTFSGLLKVAPPSVLAMKREVYGMPSNFSGSPKTK